MIDFWTRDFAFFMSIHTMRIGVSCHSRSAFHVVFPIRRRSYVPRRKLNARCFLLEICMGSPIGRLAEFCALENELCS